MQRGGEACLRRRREDRPLDDEAAVELQQLQYAVGARPLFHEEAQLDVTVGEVRLKLLEPPHPVTIQVVGAVEIERQRETWLAGHSLQSLLETRYCVAIQ